MVESAAAVPSRRSRRKVDGLRVDATAEQGIAAQIAEDDAEALRDAAAYARRGRRKVGLSQAAFARRIGVPVDTVRNWSRAGARPPVDVGTDSDGRMDLANDSLTQDCLTFG